MYYFIRLLMMKKERRKMKKIEIQTCLLYHRSISFCEVSEKNMLIVIVLIGIPFISTEILASFGDGHFIHCSFSLTLHVCTSPPPPPQKKDLTTLKISFK